MPPLPRFHKLPEDKRRRILDAAADEFAENGFDGASFNRIIAAAGISKGAMYYYFADKADAYGAVMDEMMDRVEAVAAAAERPTDAESYWAAIAVGMGQMTTEFIDDPKAAALMRSLYARGPGEATYRRLMERSHAWVERLLGLGAELGAVRDDVPRDLLVDMVTAMMVSVDQWFDRAMMTTELEALIPISDKVLVLMRDLLEPR